MPRLFDPRVREVAFKVAAIVAPIAASIAASAYMGGRTGPVAESNKPNADKPEERKPGMINPHL